MLKIAEAALTVGAVVLYLVPATIADARERRDAFAVTMVNILLGWTVIGWFAALAWARHPTSDDRLKLFAKRAQRAVARITINAIVTRAKNRASGIPALNLRIVPMVARVAANVRQHPRG